MVKIEDIGDLPTAVKSPFSNAYGGLYMVIDKNDKHYLVMEDSHRDEYFGPLDSEQIKAFRLLAEVKVAEVDYTRGI